MAMHQLLSQDHSHSSNMNTMNTAINAHTGDAHARLQSMLSKPNLKMRRRISAIESPSDLLIDKQKDSLLSVSNTDRKTYESAIYEYEHVDQHQKSNFVLRYLYDTKKAFDRALELGNRSQCRESNGIWKAETFYECKGALRVVQRMCTRCRDCDKPKTKTDLYYIDLTERTKERTVLCHGCMGRQLYKVVGADEMNIRKQLYHYRRQQNLGIVVLPKKLEENF